MLCKDCKFFRRANEGDDHKCVSNSFVYGDIEKSDQLAYWDYESYQAGFYVGENFGCIHFKSIG